jgi:hypothetical protein
MAGGAAEAKKKAKPGEETPVNPFIDSLQQRVPEASLDSRVDLLRQLDRLGRRVNSAAADGIDVYRRQAVFSVSESLRLSIQGAPISSNGRSVPRPTDRFVVSSNPTPG